MLRYIIRRLIFMIPLVIGVTFLTFAIVNLVPGTPLANMEFNPRMSPQDIHRIQHNLGLDKPWPVRYFIWLGQLLHGNLGYSLINGVSVSHQLLTVLPNTLLLTVSALIFALILAIPLGVIASTKRNSWFDNIMYIGATAAYAMPTFWLGLLLILVFAVKFQALGWPSLPVAGTYNLRGGGDLMDRIQHLILPTITLGMVQLAGWMLYIRSSMLEVIRQDFVRTAYAKGLRQRAIFYGHAFRNALLPLVTLIGLSLPDLFGGAFITETIFAWNGMGRLATNAALNSDYTMIMGATLLFAILTMIANLIADVAYSVLDPRIRYD